MFHHEKLDVYRLTLEFIVWAYRVCRGLAGANRHARDQLLRASQSILLNIAEGNAKRSGPDRRRFLGIALGSALECAAILDILTACEAVTAEVGRKGKDMLLRIVQMLTRMTGEEEAVREDLSKYGQTDYDYDYDYDKDDDQDRWDPMRKDRSEL